MLPRTSSRPFRTLPSPLTQVRDRAIDQTQRSFPGAVAGPRSPGEEGNVNFVNPEPVSQRPSFSHFFETSSEEAEVVPGSGTETAVTADTRRILGQPADSGNGERVDGPARDIDTDRTPRDDLQRGEDTDRSFFGGDTPQSFPPVRPLFSPPLAPPQFPGSPFNDPPPRRRQPSERGGRRGPSADYGRPRGPPGLPGPRPPGPPYPSPYGPYRGPPPQPYPNRGDTRGLGGRYRMRGPQPIPNSPYPPQMQGPQGPRGPPMRSPSGRPRPYPTRRPPAPYPPPPPPNQNWTPPPPPQELQRLPLPLPPMMRSDGPLDESTSPATTGPRIPAPPIVKVPSKKAKSDLDGRPGTVRSVFPPPHTVPLPSMSHISSLVQAGAGMPRSFTRPVMPTELVDFPVIQDKRVSFRVWIGMPLYTGGSIVSGRLEVRIKGTKDEDIRVGRMSVDIVGVEELSFTRKHVFLSVASELIDDEHPPPPAMLRPIENELNIFWPIRPCRANIPFELLLPDDVGPGHFYSARARIRYIIHGTMLLSINGEKTLVRCCRDIRLLSTLPPNTLAPFPTPLIVVDERPLVFGKTQTIKVTAGLQRPVWVSGTTLYLDVSIQNNTRIRVRKIKLKLRRHVMAYKSVPTLQNEDKSMPKMHERVPDWIDKKTLSHSELNVGTRWRGTRENSIDILTCEVEIPRGQATVKLGRFFEVRYFVDVECKTAVGAKVSVQLPITIVHMNSLDGIPTTTVNEGGGKAKGEVLRFVDVLEGKNEGKKRKRGKGRKRKMVKVESMADGSEKASTQGLQGELVDLLS